MKIQYCSDLHLEFPENQKFLARNPLKPVGDILVLAGDVVTFQDQEKANGFFDFVCDHFSAVYWVPGNHEYYGADINDKPNPLFEKIRDNLFLVNNETVVVSHHVPTLMNYPRIYKNSPLTEAFAVELFDLIADSAVDCWIYGHHHINTPEFRVGKTRMLTNQLGYVHRYEYKSFEREKMVEV